jgi:hypothetical protein
MKKVIVSFAVAGGVFMLAGNALAHEPSAYASCPGLDVSAVGYHAGGADVSVVIDGSQVGPGHVDQDYTHTFHWSQTSDHNYDVEISGAPGEATLSYAGKQEACQIPTTTVLNSTTTTVPVQTTVSEESTTTAGTEISTTVTSSTVSDASSSTLAPEQSTVPTESSVITSGGSASTTENAPGLPVNSSPTTIAPSVPDDTALPVTGFPVGWFAFAALCLIAAGSAIVVARRRV